jgi:hypothetical protein
MLDISQTKFESILVPKIQHDAFNILTELIFINSGKTFDKIPWKSDTRWWAKTVSVLKKINRDHGVSVEQLAFYIFRCRPKEIRGQEFGKMAVVAKKLFRYYDLQQLVDLYRASFKPSNSLIIDTPKQATRTKSLSAFLKELQNE